MIDQLVRLIKKIKNLDDTASTEGIPTSNRFIIKMLTGFAETPIFCWFTFKTKFMFCQSKIQLKSWK